MSNLETVANVSATNTVTVGSGVSILTAIGFLNDNAAAFGIVISACTMFMTGMFYWAKMFLDKEEIIRKTKYEIIQKINDSDIDCNEKAKLISEIDET